MQNNTAFSKITIDSGNAKKEKFSLSHSLNTTASFGEVQPAQVRILVPNSKTIAGVDSLVRLAPMVAPTFGDMKLKVWHHFVGMSDLLRSFTKFLTQEPYGAVGQVRKQTTLPKMRLKDLSTLALIGARISCYIYDSDSSQSDRPVYLFPKADNNTAQAFSNLIAAQGLTAYVAYQDSRFPGYSGAMFSPSLLDPTLRSNLIPMGNIVHSDNSVLDWFDHPADTTNPYNQEWETISLQSADLVFTRNFGFSALPDVKVAFAVRLSAFGKRIRKILIAAGYKLNFTSVAEVNLLPLMAYYKAYFDSFGLCLYQNYESTNANVLLQSFDMGNNMFDLGNAEFCRFITDLGTCYVTDEQDFISAHQRTDAVSPSQAGFVNNIVVAPNYNGQDLVPAEGIDSTNENEAQAVRASTNHIFINRVNHTEVDSELLKRLYKVTNRNTIAGRRIAELLRAAGYGKYVDEQKSSFIGYTEVRIDVSDINATADSTNEATERSSTLGQYVGKGVGYDRGAANKTFSFENDEFGYWVTMFAIVPNSGYCQGVDPLLYDTDKFDMYDREMDGLGMEFSRKSVVVGSEDWHDEITDGDYDDFDESFGLVPRFTRYKVAHNVCNGDFSLRGVRDSYLPFTLDKFIEINDKFVEELPVESGQARRYAATAKAFEPDLPLAGNAWRYNSRYPWLNNFERIFASFSIEDSVGSVYSQLEGGVYANLPVYELTYNQYDSFIIQAAFVMNTYAPMLAISDSYGTTDENNGHGDMMMGKA